MDNIIGKQISSFTPSVAPINSSSNNQSSKQLQAKKYQSLNSNSKIVMIPQQSSFVDNQFLQNQQKQGQHKANNLKLIRNPEAQTLLLPSNKKLQIIVASDTHLPKQVQLFKQAPCTQKDIVQNCARYKCKDQNILKIGLDNSVMRDSRSRSSQAIHIRKLKSGFIYHKKSPQVQQQNKNIIFEYDDSHDFKESPTSILTKQRSYSMRKQITQMAQILKMLEIRLATFEDQRGSELIKQSELKKQPVYSQQMVQPERNKQISSGLSQTKLKNIQSKTNQQIINKRQLPSKSKIQELLNKQSKEEIINQEQERINQDKNDQRVSQKMLNQKEIYQQRLDLSIEKQALEKQIQRLIKTIRDLRQQNNHLSKSPQRKQPLYNINQSAQQNSNQIKFARKSQKKTKNCSSNRLLDAGKIIHLSSSSMVPINSNISFSRLGKQINLPQPSWQVPLLQVQFRDIIVPAIPKAPNSNSSQEQLYKLAQKVYELFGLTRPEGKDLAIRKYKNCVLFDVLHKQNSTILWNYSGKFYFGGWCKTIGERHGSGIQVAPKKYYYEGQFLKGKRHGSGVLRTFSGQIYDGQWFEGSRHGRGAHLDPTSKTVFNGEWKFDQKEGHGWLKSQGQQYYFGLFRNGEKQGFGTESFLNGDKYRGQYRRGKFHGRGCYFWANGARYQGDFVQGLRHGLGSWVSAERTDIYIGSYKDDQKCGYGRYISGSGCIYEGEFDKDSRHGKGRLTYADCTEIKGVWKQGVLVPMQNKCNQHEDQPLTRANRAFPSNVFASRKKDNFQQH